MLEDRAYMRQPTFGRRPSVTVVLLAVNVAVFILQLIVYSTTAFPLDNYFALSTEGLRHGFVWQLLTFQFMHAGWVHLLFNCIVIFSFGRELESSLDLKTFLTLYLGSGAVGGLLQGLAGFIFGGNFLAPVVGASAGAYGLVAAYAGLYPDRRLMILPIPVPIAAKYLLVAFAIFGVGGLILSISDNGAAMSANHQRPMMAHAAHLGGMITGILFVRYFMHWLAEWPTVRRPKRTPVRRPVKILSQKSAHWNPGPPAEEELAPEEFLSREVDPILEKISAHGIQSLTERERRILKSAGTRIGKR